MRIQLAKPISGLLFAGLVALPGVLQAQTHYPQGVEGIKGASLPPPGFYVRDYNYFYWSDNLKGGPPDFNVFAYVQAPRLVYISDFQILGGFYGADVLVPFPYQKVTAGGATDSKFGLGDICVEPITLSWHPKQFDLAVGYAFWAPSGDYSPTSLSSGKGFWAQMLTAGATWYPDEEKTWSLSLLNRYEFNQEQQDTDITPGQYLSMEWGIAKNLRKTIDVGLAGYYQVQTTKSSGQNAPNDKPWVVGLGPEISMVCPKLGLITSIRYVYEIESHGRPQGNMLNVTLTRRF
ncbi:MAG: transporter [Verrucomicrobiota bacterium]|jgi:hypothetical protein